MTSSPWVAHVSDTGKTFYYNNDTKASTWEKPEELKTKKDKMMEKCGWKEYTTAEGKIYYHNPTTNQTTWTIPKEVEEIKSLPDEEGDKLGKKNPSSGNLPGISPNADSPMEKVVVKRYSDQYETQDEAKQAFRALLQEYNIQSTCTYDVAIKTIIEDARFGALKHNNERKQVFNSYKQQKINDERDLERKQAKENEYNLFDFLVGHPNLFNSMRYHKASQVFQSEVVWLKVPERTRKDIFHEALRRRDRNEKDADRQMHNNNRAYVNKFINADSKLSVESRWKQFLVMLEQSVKDKNDTKLSSIINNDIGDVLDAFESQIKTLEEEWAQSNKTSKQLEYRNARKNRQAYWNLLKSMEKQGQIELTSKFKDIFPELKENLIVQSMYHQHGSNVVDLFKIFIYRMVLKHNADKKKEILSIPENVEFYEYLKGIKNEITSKTRYEDIAADEYKITDEHGDYILRHLKNKIKKKMQKVEENKKSLKRQRYNQRSMSGSIDASTDDRYHNSKRRKVRD